MEPKVARCLLISKVLVADGIMTAQEREFLHRAMVGFGLSEDERQRVIELEGWDEAEHIVAAMTEREKRALVDDLTEAALIDGKLSPHELEAVQRIAQALGIG
ncbi:MAG: TerB family tellurite resistance protein [Myxococcales bacterium]|nr:TerB family tellurite resistance protein [Myxococcales bacterium]MCB9578717.1 TerB family tellurite resistance protein [Polyangiaceae bacterium]